MIEIRSEDVAPDRWIETARHPLGAPFDDGMLVELVVFGRQTVVDCGQDLSEDGNPEFAADVHKELVAIIVKQLGQRKVMPMTDLRPGPHRGAEACARRLGAVYCDEERSIPRRRIRGIGERAVTKHVVLDGNGRQLARPNSDECQLGGGEGS